MKRHASRGYTLLEIMVVVFILGLLATLVAPRILGRTDDARRTKAVADMKGIEQALNLYRLDSGGYPTTEQGIEALVTRPTRPPVPKSWNPNGYLDRVPVDPWGNAYVYVSDGNRFTLRSHGADGTEGGDGKFADVDNARN
jgi:general secretion pathway protein G